MLKQNKVQGAVLYGDTGDGAWYQELMEQGKDISTKRQSLIFGKACFDAVA